jgi:hypothetical protein
VLVSIYIDDLFLDREAFLVVMAPFGDPMRVNLFGLMLSLDLVIGVLLVLGPVESTPLLNDGRATRLGASTESLIMLLSSSIALKIFSSSLLGVAMAVLLTGFGVVELIYLPPAV